MGTDIFGDYIFFYLATILLFILKFAGFVGWAWWIIFSPLAAIIVLWIISLLIERFS